MQAIFIRHGSAEPAGPVHDADRALTDKGREEVRATAKAIADMGLAAGRVLASPLLRAVQSAEIVADVHGAPEPEVVECLAPPGEFARLNERLAELSDEGVETVALVGHTPSLEDLISRLVAGARGIALSLSKAGAACVDMPPPDSADRAELRWLLRRKQLAKLAGK